MSAIDDLQKLVEEGEKLAPQGGSEFTGYNGRLQPDYVSWRLRTMAALEELGSRGKIFLKEIEQDKNGSYFYESSASRVLGALRAAVALASRVPSAAHLPTSQTSKDATSGEVFIVHGHDEALLTQAARFIEKLGLVPLILFEKAGKGRTIIEKLEQHSFASYALVLLTPDDLGKKASDTGPLLPRARQNVILELGYFLGKLGRDHVAVLCDESVELPSDYRGVEYIRVDAEGAWRLKLAREMKAAGIRIDMNRAV